MSDTEKYSTINYELFPEGGEFSRLEPVNKSFSIEEGVQTRIKDPLWMIARQWQLGEFQAQNGGSPVRTELSIRERIIDQLKRGRDSESPFNPLDENIPMEMQVESETRNSDQNLISEGWNPRRLEYSFEAKGRNTHLIAEEYDGKHLDWHSFNIEAGDTLSEASQNFAYSPSRVRYGNMPSPRWWKFEDHKIDVGSIDRLYLNYLTMLLVEFTLLYSNDWYILPVPIKVGHIRELRSLRIFDTFGVVTFASPVTEQQTNGEADWEVFTISPTESSPIAHSKAEIFFFPNNLDKGGLVSKPVEEVSFFRDELANLVWAIEKRYQIIKDKNNNPIDNGEVINRADREPRPPAGVEAIPSHYWDYINNQMIARENISGDNEPGTNIIGPLDWFDLMSYTPSYWIPYIARRIHNSSIIPSGQIILRRARTKGFDSANPQYKGVFINESRHIYEEEVPRLGVKLERVWQLARGIDGEPYLWRSRKKNPDIKRGFSNLRFDYLTRRK